MAKDVKRNVLVVGTRGACFHDSVELGEMHWTSEMPETGEVGLVARIRHGGELVSVARRVFLNQGLVKLELGKHVFGLAPGQAVVLYRGEKCLGGGIIQ